MTAQTKALDDRALDTLFRAARTYKSWADRPVEADKIRALYDLFKWGPTSANCCPARFVFIQSPQARERLKPHLDLGNVEKTMTAPVTVIVAHDLEFYTRADVFAPHAPDKVRALWEGKPAAVTDTAFRNATLQGGYLIMAARALGLDCGPMSGFSKKGVKGEFFPDKNWEANFLVNIGYGTEKGLFPRAPRFDFDEVCEIL